MKNPLSPHIAFYLAAGIVMSAAGTARADNPFANSPFNAPYKTPTNTYQNSAPSAPQSSPYTPTYNSAPTNPDRSSYTPSYSHNSRPAYIPPSDLHINASPSWGEQQERNKMREREAMQEQSREQHGSAQVQQAARWEQEWRDQHPGEPMPNFGQLEKMHRGEIIQTINAGWAQSRQNRQNELKRNYLLSRQNQEQKNAANHVTWSAQQWKNWDSEYDGQMQQHAKDYLEGVKQAGEIWRMQEEDRKRREVFGY